MTEKKQFNITDSEREARSLRLKNALSSLGNSGMTTREKGQKNEEEILVFVLLMGATTKKILKKFIGSSYHKLVKRMKEKGLVSEVLNPISKTQKLIVLTELGCYWADVYREKRDIEPVEYSASPGAPSTVHHDLLAQSCLFDYRAEIEEKGGEMIAYRSKHQLDKLGGEAAATGLKIKVADAELAYRLGDGIEKVVGVEVEMTKKRGWKIDQFVQKISEAIESGRWDGCIVRPHSLDAVTHYREAFGRTEVPVWEFDERRRRYLETGETVELLPGLAKKVKVKLLSDKEV